MKLQASQLYLKITNSININDANRIWLFFSNVMQENMVGMFLCQQGECKILMDGKSYIIHKGDICLYFPKQVLQISEHSSDLKGIVLISMPEFVRSIIISTHVSDELLYIQSHPCITLPATQYLIIEHLAEAIVIKLMALGEHTIDIHNNTLSLQTYKAMGNAIIYEVLSVYESSLPVEPLKQKRQDVVYQKFMLSLFQNYRKQREVIFYANELCLTPRYFSTVIKNSSGKSASQWISEIVIAEMKKKLLENNMSIKEIAYYFNFNTQSFFGKYFKSYTGMSPREFKRLNV